MSLPDPPIEPNFDLQGAHTLGARSYAEFGVIADSDESLLAALQWAEQKAMPVTILGGGSNVILEPVLRGLTVLVRTRGITMDRQGDATVLRVKAGENWHDLVRFSLGQGLGGLESLALIPGNVGAAPIQNIGAYGSEIADCLTRLQAFDRHSGTVVWLDAQQCRFGYRTSRFKEERHHSGVGPRYVVLTVELSLSRVIAAPLDEPRYGDVNTELQAMGRRQVWPVDVAEAVCRIRQRKLPDPRQVGNVGSVFKNPVVEADQAERLRQEWPLLKTFAVEDGVRLAAAQLIDLAGWKGRSLGSASVWSRQPLVLVQPHAAIDESRSSADFIALLQAIQTDVKAQFGVALEVEPRHLGVEPDA